MHLVIHYVIQLCVIGKLQDFTRNQAVQITDIDKEKDRTQNGSLGNSTPYLCPAGTNTV